MTVPPVREPALKPLGAPCAPPASPGVDERCPVCGAALLHEKCKVLCRSEACVYRIVFNCSEF
ncbi:MAG: hypothetical protein ACK4N5_11605 [Myxococcales bacterium]